MTRAITFLLSFVGAGIGLMKAYSLFRFGGIVMSIPHWDTGRLRGENPLTTALYTSYVFWGTGGLIGLCCGLGLIGGLLALGFPRIARGVLLIAALLTLILAGAMAGLLIYTYEAPRGMQLALSLAGPVALSGTTVFIAGLFSRRRTQAVPPPRRPLFSPAPPPTGVCLHCQRPLKPGVAFCTACGAAVGSGQRVPNIVPRCSNPRCGCVAAVGQRFCDVCGATVR